MYLPTLSDDELLRYASTLQLTPLESELVRRLSSMETESEVNRAYAETWEAENEELREKVAALEEKIEDLEAENDKLKIDLANSEEELAELKGVA